MENLQTQNQNNIILKQKKRFSLKGNVIKKVLDKTITVLITRKFRHRLYQKTILSTKKYLVHDQKNEAQVGDQVKITASRHFSKRKYFYLADILKTKKTLKPSVVDHLKFDDLPKEDQSSKLSKENNKNISEDKDNKQLSHQTTETNLQNKEEDHGSEGK